MKGNQRNWSNILFRRKPLGGELIWGDIVRTISSMGNDCTFCTPLSLGLPMADPFPSSPPWPFHLPPCLREHVSSSWQVWGCCGLPPAPGPWPAALPELLLSVSIAAVFVVFGVFLTFLLVKNNFQTQEWNISRKVMDSAVTEPPEAALMEERRIPHSIFPSPPRPCLQTYKFLLDDQVSCISSSIFL